MSLADRCIHEFDSGIRSRGEQYFREDRVTLRSRGQAMSGHIVQGESEYEVVLDWGFSREQLAVCCTCPYYDEHAICKHIWATILAAERQHRSPRQEPARHLADGSGGLRSDEDDDRGSMMTMTMKMMNRRLRRAARPASVRPARNRPRQDAAQAQVAAATHLGPGRCRAGESRPGDRPRAPKTREIWYVLDESWAATPASWSCSSFSAKPRPTVSSAS